MSEIPEELLAWNLVRLKHLPGDRRDHFTTPGDLRTILRALVAERRKREVDPTLGMLREAPMRHPSTPEERHAQARAREMHDLIALLAGRHADVARLPADRLTGLLTLEAAVRKFLAMKDRLTALPGGRRRRPSPQRTPTAAAPLPPTRDEP